MVTEAKLAEAGLPVELQPAPAIRSRPAVTAKTGKEHNLDGIRFMFSY
jgi:hypothetical protein